MDSHHRKVFVMMGHKLSVTGWVGKYGLAPDMKVLNKSYQVLISDSDKRILENDRVELSPNIILVGGAAKNHGIYRVIQTEFGATINRRIVDGRLGVRVVTNKGVPSVSGTVGSKLTPMVCDVCVVVDIHEMPFAEFCSFVGA